MGKKIKVVEDLEVTHRNLRISIQNAYKQASPKKQSIATLPGEMRNWANFAY